MGSPVLLTYKLPPPSNLMIKYQKMSLDPPKKSALEWISFFRLRASLKLHVSEVLLCGFLGH